MLTNFQLEATTVIPGPSGRRRAWAWLGQMLCAWVLLGVATTVRGQEPPSKEYQIKAAYLYNFAKFVEWPAGSFANSESPLVIGVFGQNPFGDEIKAIARDHKINGRSIVFKTVANAADANGVHVLFFAAGADDQVAPTRCILRSTWWRPSGAI
jgi:hypothetical protein